MSTLKSARRADLGDRCEDEDKDGHQLGGCRGRWTGAYDHREDSKKHSDIVCILEVDWQGLLMDGYI
jgi:hypothetical protein